MAPAAWVKLLMKEWPPPTDGGSMPEDAPRLKAALVLLADSDKGLPPLRRRASNRPNAPNRPRPATPPPTSGK